MKTILIVFGIFILLTLQSCALVNVGAAYYKSTDHFLAHGKDSRILYEEGAEDFTNIIAELMEGSVAAVESIHGEKFSQEIQVHICATLDSYQKHTTMIESRGATIGDKLFLSPSL
ncbi:MAG: hypothetical protein KUG82_23240 [Pseudomonadales bacterium]|nr:hypothetical protein [Pseudomonadales bacterium]